MSFSGPLAQWYPLRRRVLGVCIAALLALGVAAEARQPHSAEAPVVITQLPPQAHAVYRKILAGGPFTSDRDGAVFANRERILPRRPRGFYREYTVSTPGARDRGARRIVCGGQRPTAPEACFYSADHYASFRRISP